MWVDNSRRDRDFTFVILGRATPVMIIMVRVRQDHLSFRDFNEQIPVLPLTTPTLNLGPDGSGSREPLMLGHGRV